MTTLAANKNRIFEFKAEDINDVPMIAADIIYAGAAVGDNGSGLARPFVDGDPFLGFAVAKADNSAGAASAITVRVLQRGTVKLTLAGTVTAAKLADPIYATDDDTFSIADSGSDTAIGSLTRFISSTSGMVYFEALPVRSL